MTAVQRAAKNVASIVSRVNDDAQTTRIPVATAIYRVYDRKGHQEFVAVDFSRTMSKR